MKTTIAIMLGACLTLGCAGAPAPPPEPPPQPEKQVAPEPPPEPEAPISPEASKTGGGAEDSKLTEADHFDISTTIKAKSRDLAACYGKVLDEEAPPKDGFLVESAFQIEEDGSVAGVEMVQATRRDAEAERCFLKVIAALQFGPPPEGRVVTVKYPFKIRRK